MKISEFTNPEEFQRFCHLLFSAENNDFQSIDDSGGDLGIDGYIQGNAIFMMYCPEKPQKNTSKNQKRKISSDITKASNTIRQRGLTIKNLIFVTPMNLRADVILFLEEQCKLFNLRGISYGEDKLIELAAKHPHIQKQFPFLIIPDIMCDVKEIKDTVNTIKEILHATQRKENEEEKDAFKKEPRLREAFKEYQAAEVNKFLSKSREIYYDTTEDVVRLQAILNITFNSVFNGQNTELIYMCNEGIRISDKLKRIDLKAILMAQKALLVQIEVDWLRSSMWFEEQIAERIGFFDEMKYLSQLKQLQDKAKCVDDLLQEAVHIASTNKFYWTLAGIYTTVGNMCAGTYITVAKTRPDLAGFYDNRCKSSLNSAKKIYTALNYEEGVLNSIHNLANHLRATGEAELSKKYAQEVLEKANKKGFTILALKASELLYSLKHITAEDYAMPPHKFLEIMKKRREKVLEDMKNKTKK